MITLFTGSPGAGKTASMVDFLSKLPGDRPLFVHGIDGVSGLNGLTLKHQVIDANNWPDLLPDGAILIIDEVQDVWRPRGAGSAVPAAVKALETHRHHGVDVYLTTQAPNLLDSNVRRLVGRHVHIRDTGVLGRYWYEWPECNDSLNWKTCINKKRFSLPKKAFELYKSSSLHTTPVRGVPRALIYGGVSVVLLAIGVVLVIKMMGRISNPAPTAPPVNVPVMMNAGGGGVSFGANGNRLIDDRLDWIPRVSNKPESAPAYDHLRVVAVMPQVVGGMCVGEVCSCITQQGTNAGLGSAECKRWIENPPFNPYPTLRTDPPERQPTTVTNVPIAPAAGGSPPASSHSARSPTA